MVTHFLTLSLQNVVVVSPTVCAHGRGPKKVPGMLVPAPFRQRLWLTTNKHAPVLYVLPSKFAPRGSNWLDAGSPKIVWTLQLHSLSIGVWDPLETHYSPTFGIVPNFVALGETVLT